MMKTIPGPTSLTNFPARYLRPRSHCLTILNGQKNWMYSTRERRRSPMAPPRDVPAEVVLANLAEGDQIPGQILGGEGLDQTPEGAVLLLPDLLRPLLGRGGLPGQLGLRALRVFW